MHTNNGYETGQICTFGMTKVVICRSRVTVAYSSYFTYPTSPGHHLMFLFYLPHLPRPSLYVPILLTPPPQAVNSCSYFTYTTSPGSHFMFLSYLHHLPRPLSHVPILLRPPTQAMTSCSYFTYHTCPGRH